MSKFIQLDICTEDQIYIVGRMFVPQGEPIAVVLIVPAMGVKQQYYTSFADWLREQGYLVVTFDYRGIGLSRSGSLRGYKADIMDWVQLDCAAMVRTVPEAADRKPFYLIGHSLGGQIYPFLPDRSSVTKMVTVASGSGYWGDAPPRLRRVSWYLWYFVVPLSLRLFGYFPGKRLRKVGDLPHAVMAQWRRWCLHPDYVVGVEGEQARQLYSNVKTPITSLSFSDDEYMSARNIEALHNFYTAAPRVMKRISPSEVNVDKIGHFGFFRPKFKESLWKKYLLPELS
ncbi:MAG: alpha/beta fold hydrolase [Thermodesulfobacteriota bacterium]|nr:alpha/beta fold hydrolase [Thermodesulfobacteriota bacterium]